MERFQNSTLFWRSVVKEIENQVSCETFIMGKCNFATGIEFTKTYYEQDSGIYGYSYARAYDNLLTKLRQFTTERLASKR